MTAQVKTANPADTPINQQAARDEHIQHLQRLLMLGGAAGLGGVGLMHMFRKAKKKIDSLTPKPDYDAIATATPANLMTSGVPKIAAEKSAVKLTQDQQDLLISLGLPVAGAGAGALIGSARAQKGEKLRAALMGAATGGGVGTAASLLGTRMGGRAITAPLWGLKNLFGRGGATGQDFSVFGGHLPRLDSSFEGGMSLAGRPLAAGIGVAGGAYLGKKLLNEDGKKQKENIDSIETAKKEYFDSLLNDEKTAAAFDKAFETVRHNEKFAWFWSGAAKGTDPNINNNAWEWYKDTTALLLGGLGLSTVGAAGLGGTYMYNRTKEKSDAKQLTRARVARERLNSLPGPWIDPREIAQVKALATTGG